jgi:hypothetical protein
VLSLADARRPFVVLHGPLVRTIGGFAHIVFDYRTVRDLLTVDLQGAGDAQAPAGFGRPVAVADSAAINNLPLDPAGALRGERNLLRFNEFCLKSCGRKCDGAEAFARTAVPPNVAEVTTEMAEGRSYPGFCVYLWVLRSLCDLARLAAVPVSSVVEDVSAATETTRMVLPSLLARPAARAAIATSGLGAALEAANLTYPSGDARRAAMYRLAARTLDAFRLTDANLLSYVLAEGQYTSPVQTYRYRTRQAFVNALADPSQGTDDRLGAILDTLFPEEAQGGHPGYRIVTSYVRTSALREPIRVELFDLPEVAPAEGVIGALFLLSLPYQEYGLPVILYYADKLARTPTRLVRTIVEREYLEVLQNRFDSPVEIMRVLGRLSRGYFQREGVKP